MSDTERPRRMQTVSPRRKSDYLADTREAKLMAERDALVTALKWFADPDNWIAEELSNGVYFSAEWKLGLDPREIAKHALAKAEGGP